MSTSNIQFRLRKPDLEKTTIYVMFYFRNGKRFVYGTGLKIPTALWDDVDMRLKNTGVDDQTKRENNRINKKLEEYLDVLYELFRELDKKQINPTKEIVKKKLDNTFKVIPIDDSIDLIQYAEKVIEDSLNGMRLTKKGLKLQYVTIKGYKTTVFHLNEFKKVHTNSLKLADIDMAFYKKFVQYFHSEKKATNTIGKNIKNVKVFMKAAYNEGISQNRVWENEGFVTLEEVSDQIYLTMEELKAISKINYSGNKKLTRVRDLFILACYTGLRYADLGKLSKDNLMDGGKMIKLRMNKNTGLVVIPLNPIAKAILDKNDGNPPKMLSNHDFNLNLKTLGENAKINEKVTHTMTVGGVRKDTTQEKYKYITVHTARRTFATNMFLAGVPTISIMKITGHKTEKSFLKYIRISAEENAKMLQNHSFFSGISK